MQMLPFNTNCKLQVILNKLMKIIKTRTKLKQQDTDFFFFFGQTIQQKAPDALYLGHWS